MQQINIFFWAAMGIAGLMLLLLVVRLILDKANAGRLPAAVASMRHDRVLSSPGPDASAALVNGSGLGNGVPAPSHLEPELPPIPVDTSPLNVRAGDGDLGAQEAAVAVQTQRSPAPVSRLLGIGGLYVGQVFSLSAGEHSIGRQDSEILLADDTQVSRRHAMISVGPDGLATLTDSGSTNGSYVNEQRVSSMLLAPGDTLRFGTSLFKVEA